MTRCWVVLAAAATLALGSLGVAEAQRGPRKLHAVTDGGRTGFVNGRGQVVVPLRYEAAGRFDDTVRVVAVRRGDKWGFVNVRGKEVLAPRLDWVGRSWGDGLILVGDKDRIGYVDADGRLAIPTTWTLATEASSSRFSAGYAQVTVEGQPRYLDRKGVLQPVGFSPPLPPLLSAKEKAARERLWRGKLWSYRDAGGRYGAKRSDDTQVTPARYARAELRSSEGRLRVWNDAGGCGFVDASGREVIALVYEDCLGFSSGLAAVRAGGRWGFVDLQGKLVVPPRFQDAGSFDKLGGAAVRERGAWGLIDRKGRWLIAPRFPEEFDFAGKEATWLFQSLDGSQQSHLINQHSK
ncbi:MAG: WG repeat-containing protein, partial [Caulobacteraceae bacterium]|nr:WG repeat-containing protein [Caulobacteraceae bacterium]